MVPRVDIISCGTLSRNVFWGEKSSVRPAHATTTLIRDDGKTLLIDPGLPAELMAQRLDERVGLKPSQIDIVFLTCFRPVHRRSIELFAEAEWFMSEAEHRFAADALNSVFGGSDLESSAVSYEELEAEAALVGRLQHAPDSLSPSVDIFPAFGPSPGSAALIVRSARTVVVAGDAIIGRDHLENGRVWERSYDPEQAKDAFLEIREIADAIIPGHDNILYLG